MHKNINGSDQRVCMRYPVLTRMFIILFVTVLFLDQLTKSVINLTLDLGQSITLIPNVLWLTHVRNTGISFSFLTGNNLLLIFVVVAILGLLLFWHDQFSTPLAKVAYVLILAGLLGNLIDRILLGSVVDFVNLGWFPVFNVADSAISIAFVLLLYDELMQSKIIKKMYFAWKKKT